MELQLLFYEYKDLPKYFTPYYVYGILVEGVQVGTLIVRTGSDDEHLYDGHIGYTIEPEYQGHYYSYHACLLVVPILKELGFDHVYITCETTNIASHKIIERLGCTYLNTLPIPGYLRKVFSKDETVKDIYRWELNK